MSGPIHRPNAVETLQLKASGVLCRRPTPWERRQTPWVRPGNGFGTPRVDAGLMDSTRARTVIGQTVWRGIVRLRSHTGTVPRPCLQACHERSRSVPRRGKTGGIQSSVPQVRPPDNSDKLPARLRSGCRQGFDTLWTHHGAGPTAHKNNPYLCLLLDCCCADPSWAVL